MAGNIYLKYGDKTFHNFKISDQHPDKSFQIIGWIKNALPGATNEELNALVNWYAGVYSRESYATVCQIYPDWINYIYNISKENASKRFKVLIDLYGLARATSKSFADDIYILHALSITIHEEIHFNIHKSWNLYHAFPIPNMPYYGVLTGYNNVLKNNGIRGEYEQDDVYEETPPDGVIVDDRINPVKEDIKRPTVIGQVVKKSIETFEIREQQKTLLTIGGKDFKLNIFPIVIIAILILMFKSSFRA